MLLGDGGVGKTTFVTRHSTGHFVKSYFPTSGVKEECLRFFMGGENIGAFTFKILEFSGQEKLDSPLEKYPVGNIDGVIVMFDLASNLTFRNVNQWIDDARKVTEAPIILIGNKADLLSGRKVSTQKISDFLHHGKGKQNVESYYEVSAKTNYNFEKPFLAFARILTDDNSIQYK